MNRWTTAASRAARALPALAVAGCLVAAVSYAAPGSDRGPSGRAAEELRRQGSPRPPRPLITRHPAKTTASATVTFSFKAPRDAAPRFQCRFDGSRWKRCRSPIAFGDLTPGEHSFSVRALGRRGGHSAATRYRWRLFEPKSFTVEPRLSSLGALYPGAPAQVLPVVLRNPNPAPILITSLKVAATADPPGCGSAANLELTPSSASPSAPLSVPAESSVSLPAAGATAPTIALRDLPVNQDACQRARFPLAFSGEAHG